MRSLPAALVAAISLAAGPVQAQTYPPPYAGPVIGAPPPYSDLYLDPAYRKFLKSPYTVRGYSAATRGFADEYRTSFGIEGSYRQPGYMHQRIMPDRFESYGYVPGHGAYRASPWWTSGYEVPGYSYREVIPYGPYYRR